MRDARILEMLQEALWIVMSMAAPMLAAALIVGLTVGILQALTSIQELTLTFVPKIAALGAVLWLAMDFMGRKIISFYQDSVIPIVAGG